MSGYPQGVSYSSELERIVVSPKTTVEYQGFSLTVGAQITVAKKPAVTIGLQDIDGRTEFLTIKLEIFNALVETINNLSASTNYEQLPSCEFDQD